MQLPSGISQIFGTGPELGIPVPGAKKYWAEKKYALVGRILEQGLHTGSTWRGEVFEQTGFDRKKFKMQS